jgi:hypothetical protein
MTALQSIIKEAKSLKKQYPKRFTKWTDYVKQASAIYASKHKGKSPVGKKKATKKVIKKKVVKKRIVKKTISKKPTEKVILKKVHAAKTTSKNLYNKLDKLDEAQHAHMSKKIGSINKMLIDHYREILKKIDIFEKQKENHIKALKNKKNTPHDNMVYKRQLESIKKYLKELKIQRSEQKKLL